jgi:hypothetical protein
MVVEEKRHLTWQEQVGGLIVNGMPKSREQLPNPPLVV